MGDTQNKSVFEQMTKHGERLDDHDDKLEEHGIQLKLQEQQIKSLHENNVRLEHTVMTENRETRNTITQTNEKLHELISHLMGYKSGQNNLAHTLKMQRMESIAKIVGILAGSGGLLVIIAKLLLE